MAQTFIQFPNEALGIETAIQFRHFDCWMEPIGQSVQESPITGHAYVTDRAPQRWVGRCTIQPPPSFGRLADKDAVFQALPGVAAVSAGRWNDAWIGWIDRMRGSRTAFELFPPADLLQTPDNPLESGVLCVGTYAESRRRFCINEFNFQRLTLSGAVSVALDGPGEYAKVDVQAHSRDRAGTYHSLPGRYFNYKKRMFRTCLATDNGLRYLPDVPIPADELAAANVKTTDILSRNRYPLDIFTPRFLARLRPDFIPEFSVTPNWPLPVTLEWEEVVEE